MSLIFSYTTQLKKDYKLRRECHIEHDWLLIYNYLEETHIVFERTGSHSDLFK